MSEAIKEKIKVLRQLGIQLTQHDLTRINESVSIVQLDNVARDIISHYGDNYSSNRQCCTGKAFS